jgi:hypothetical protein
MIDRSFAVVPALSILMLAATDYRADHRVGAALISGVGSAVVTGITPVRILNGDDIRRSSAGLHIPPTHTEE